MKFELNLNTPPIPVSFQESLNWVSIPSFTFIQPMEVEVVEYKDVHLVLVLDYKFNQHIIVEEKDLEIKTPPDLFVTSLLRLTYKLRFK